MIDLGPCTRFDSQQLTVTDRITPLISLLGHHAVQFEPSMAQGEDLRQTCVPRDTTLKLGDTILLLTIKRQTRIFS